MASTRALSTRPGGALVVLLATILLATAPFAAWAETPLNPHQQRAENFLRELINLETTELRPDETRRAMEYIAGQLRDAGFPDEDIHILEPEPNALALVARYRSMSERPPLLTMAHVDVVTAEPDAWAFPPFSFGKKDGFYFGRGTQDNKTGVVHLLANFIRLKSENYRPDRDLIMAITGDEETSMNSIAWLAGEGRELIDAEIALNSDGGGGLLDDDGNPKSFWMQVGEKRYHTYRLTATNPGGHSSLPRPDNAIAQLAQALVKIAENQFPIELNDASRLMLERSARIESGPLAEDMLKAARGDIEAAERMAGDVILNATLRTTCTVTQIVGGHAENALPRQASATVNCRILPGIPPEEIEQQLRVWVDDPGISFESIYVSVASPMSPLTPTVVEAVESLVQDHWPGVPVIPEMSTGATDGLWVRNTGIPVYGVAGWMMHPDDIRAHGLDEKIGIEQFHEGAEFWYRMLKAFSQ